MIPNRWPARAHYPAIYVFAHWIWRTHPSTRLWWVSALLCIGVIFVAWLLLEYYDEPLRAYLTRKLAAPAKEPAPSYATGRLIRAASVDR